MLQVHLWSGCQRLELLLLRDCSIKPCVLVYERYSDSADGAYRLRQPDLVISCRPEQIITLSRL